MLIAIDANELCKPEASGVKSYTYNLLKALIELSDENKFILYSKKEFQRDFRLKIPKKKNFFYKIIKWSLPFWTYFRFPLELWRIRPDALFMPIQTIPFFLPKCKIIVTVHDLAFLRFPRDFTFRDRLKLSFHTHRAVKYATKIIVPSKSTREDIIRYYKIEPKKIRVVYHGINFSVIARSEATKQSRNNNGIAALHSTSFRSARNDDFFLSLKKFKIQKPYILFVGAIQPRKNIQGLIKAFEIFNTKYKILNTKYKLVIVGPKGWLYKNIFKKAQKSKYAKDIIFTGQVSKEELREFYKNAEVFVLPSFYEGFGLPLLEAMSSGVPVITSNVSSMPEVVGSAGILINPYKADEIAEAIYKVITSSDLRNKLIEKGFEQVGKFSWERCALETIRELTN